MRRWLQPGRRQLPVIGYRGSGDLIHTASHLRGDLQRLAFLLGADNSAQLSGDE
jgi:hypothetical protein